MEGKEALLEELVKDCISELKECINYRPEESLPEPYDVAVKELTLYNFNLDGVEGIASESHSGGGSTTYSQEYPKQVKRYIRRHRRMRR